MTKTLRTFISYSHKDADLRAAVVEHLALLCRDGILSLWTDRVIPAGDRFDDVIDEKLLEADLVLLLVSSAFLASEYCYGKEMSRSLARHHMGQCRVVPVILRPCDWNTAPFANFNALPTDGKPVTDRRFWHDNDEALAEVAQSLRETVTRSTPNSPARPETGDEWFSHVRAQSQAAEATGATIAGTTWRLAQSAGTLADRDTFRETIGPLMKEFEKLHDNYLDSFRRYRRILEAHADDPDGPARLIDRVESDILFRANQLTRVAELSSRQTSNADAAFIDAISTYLEPPDTDVGAARIILAPSENLRTNWAGRLARVKLQRALSENDRALRRRLGLEAIDRIVELLQRRYSNVFRAYHRLSEMSRREANRNDD